jgi:hypothetical protein
VKAQLLATAAVAGTKTTDFHLLRARERDVVGMNFLGRRRQPQGSPRFERGSQVSPHKLFSREVPLKGHLNRVHFSIGNESVLVRAIVRTHCTSIVAA